MGEQRYEKVREKPNVLSFLNGSIYGLMGDGSTVAYGETGKWRHHYIKNGGIIIF